MRGKVECAKHSYRSKKVTKEGYETIEVFSASRGDYCKLSPFLLGPFEVEDEGKSYEVKNLENLWQFSKVFPREETDGRPNNKFFERREKGWADKKAHRHVKRGVKPLYAWWNGNKFDYSEARRNIYCPYYAESVVKTKQYKQLKEKVDSGVNVIISGFDGYDYSGSTLEECFNDLSKPFGHELVLCCLLTENKVWE